ncbi:MAG: imidazole glycerol phosphate synthase subunit HisH [Proteobacteria bacterium]|nr:imidazole glycerol phosphate synthase subunit HisH [Pseudomonadota bacterium]
MIALIDVVGSNVGSLEHALFRLGYHKDRDYYFARSGESLTGASHVILVGVGSAHQAMRALNNHGLTEAITKLTVPVLGICVGMQIMYEFSWETKGLQGAESLEHSPVSCLAIFPGSVKKLAVPNHLSLPHSGWNQLEQNHHFQGNIRPFKQFDSTYVYFVHSYGAPVGGNEVIFYVDYGVKIPALVCCRNFYGTQFHPEKSAQIGSQMLQEFLKLC